MSYPKLGMHFEDVRTRVRRISKSEINPKNKERLVNSLLNQSELCDGSGAKKELVKELTSDTSFYSCAGNKTCGFGEGIRREAGTWKWDVETGWKKVG